MDIHAYSEIRWPDTDDGVCLGSMTGGDALSNGVYLLPVSSFGGQ